jgi:hypothetical protein
MIKRFGFYSLCLLAFHRLWPHFSLTSSTAKASWGQYLQMTRNKNSRSFKIHVKYIQIGLVKGSQWQHWGWLQFPWHKTMAVRFPWRKNKEGLRLVPGGNTLVLSIYRIYSYLPTPECQVISRHRATPNCLLCEHPRTETLTLHLEKKHSISARVVVQSVITYQFHRAEFLVRN